MHVDTTALHISLAVIIRNAANLCLFSGIRVTKPAIDFVI